MRGDEAWLQGVLQVGLAMPRQCCCLMLFDCIAESYPMGFAGFTSHAEGGGIFLRKQTVVSCPCRGLFLKNNE